MGDKPITRRSHSYPIPRSSRKLGHVAIMQELGSLRAAGLGMGTYADSALLDAALLEGCGVYLDP